MSRDSYVSMNVIQDETSNLRRPIQTLMLTSYRSGQFRCPRVIGEEQEEKS